MVRNDSKWNSSKSTSLDIWSVPAKGLSFAVSIEPLHSKSSDAKNDVKNTSKYRTCLSFKTLNFQSSMQCVNSCTQKCMEIRACHFSKLDVSVYKQNMESTLTRKKKIGTVVKWVVKQKGCQMSCQNWKMFTKLRPELLTGSIASIASTSTASQWCRSHRRRHRRQPVTQTEMTCTILTIPMSSSCARISLTLPLFVPGTTKNRQNSSSHASHVTFWIDSMPQRKCQKFLAQQKTLLKILSKFRDLESQNGQKKMKVLTCCIENSLLPTHQQCFHPKQGAGQVFHSMAEGDPKVLIGAITHASWNWSPCTKPLGQQMSEWTNIPKGRRPGQCRGGKWVGPCKMLGGQCDTIKQWPAQLSR